MQYRGSKIAVATLVTVIAVALEIGCAGPQSSEAHAGPARQMTSEDLTRLENGCGRRDPYACYAIGLVYLEGVEGLAEKNTRLYEANMDRACGAGSALACARTKRGKARACRSGLASACVQLGAEAGGLELAHIGCFLESKESCRHVAWHKGEAVDMEETRTEATVQLRVHVIKLRQLCDEVTKLACVELASFYERRIEWEDDVDKVEPLLKEACDAGISRGCAELGKRYRVIGHVEGALEYYGKGCDLDPGRPVLAEDPKYSHTASSCDELAALAGKPALP